MSKYFLPWQWSNLWESIFFVVWVHCLNLFFRWCTEDFDDLNKLIDTTLTREDGLTKHKFSNDTANRPNIYRGSVIWVTKNKFWGPVVSRADVWYIWFSLYQLLGTTEITKLKHMGLHIAKNILWFNISMADSFSVDIGNRSHQLVWIQFYDQVWHHLFHFKVLLHYSVGRIRNIVHNDIQIHLIWFISISVETLSHFNAIWMMQHFQNSELTIFISLILKDLLNGDCFTGFSNGSFEYDTKWAITNDFFSIVGHTLL